jgi:hypothetical protein
MSKYPFDPKEITTDEFYPATPPLYGMQMPPIRKFHTPITPKENFLRLCRKEKPLWIPNTVIDMVTVQPIIMPDANARVNGGVDWFGIQWQYEPLSRAAMVKPGTRRLSDVTEWEKELVFPNLDDIDWKKDYEENYKSCLPDELAVNFVIVNGLYERLADMTSFEDTLCSFLEEPEAVAALYERLTDFHIELMRIAKEVYGATVITFHDDMGTQRSSFFSPELFREVMMPHYQRMNKAAHEMGLYVIFHSCGSVANQIPNFIESGFDLWEGQDACNDKAALLEEYGDQLAMTVTDFGSIKNADDLKPILDMGRNGRMLLHHFRNFESDFDVIAAIYEASRKMFDE